MKHVGKKKKKAVSSYFRPEEGFVFSKSSISLLVDLRNNIASPCQPVLFCKIITFWTFEIFSVRVEAAFGSWGIAGGREEQGVSLLRTGISLAFVCKESCPTRGAGGVKV